MLSHVTIFLLIVGLASCGYPSVIPTKGRPWPLPQSELAETGSLDIISSNFQFVSITNDCDILNQAYIRYRNILFGEDTTTRHFFENYIIDYWKEIVGATEALTLDVDVQKPCEDYPHLAMNEEYELKICAPGGSATSMTLVSQTVWGALRGLETFSQLALTTNDPNTLEFNCTQILDFPRFSHRGVMLDTSRHFLPVSKILENLDLMAMNKFNVFHWHIVDSPSFPFESTTFPDLSAKGAYTPLHVYSNDDVSTIIEYSRLRGIRVVPEFDTPGHVQSWGQGQPDLLTTCYGSDGKPNGNFGPVDPSRDENYDFMENLFTEISSVFQDHYLHMGGDEVVFNCWRSNPNITAFMTQQNISDYDQLESYYVSRLLNIVGNLPKRNGFMVWQEVFDNNVALPLDAVVHIWRYANVPSIYHGELADVTAAGYQTLLSSCWYLNYINYGIDWHEYYQCDPQGFDGTNAQKRLVMGGEACMWGEYVDETNLTPRLWPRASAVAERLWSSKETTTDADEAAPRLEEHRCRLRKRGYMVEPINGPSYC